MNNQLSKTTIKNKITTLPGYVANEDQVLYMQIRMFNKLRDRLNISIDECNKLYDKYEIDEFILKMFDLFHMSGDEYIINEIVKYIKYRGYVK